MSENYPPYHGRFEAYQGGRSMQSAREARITLTDIALKRRAVAQ